MDFFPNEIHKCLRHSKLASDYTVIGRAAYIRAGQSRSGSDVIVKVEFTSQRPRIADALKLTVIDQRNGAMDRTTVRFQDIFPRKKAVGGKTGAIAPYVQISNDSAGWTFPPSEKDYQSISRLVEAYIRVFCRHDPD